VRERRLDEAAALRAAFDRSFADAPGGDGRKAAESLLAIRVAGEPYAVRLSAVAGLHSDRTIVPVPSPAAALLGVVSLRGAVAPVYQLATLLGHGASAAPPRWLFLARAAGELIGFAFDRFENHVQAAPDDFSAAAEAVGPRATVVVRMADGVRPLLDTGPLFDAIARLGDGRAKEN
jgi:chemotaxis signal transduction protein